MCLLSISLMVVATARHHLWVTFACIGVEVIVLVVMLHEVVAMKRQGSGVKLRLDE
jgi:intracellular septation protein A